MHPVIENYIAKINNLAQIDPKNLPFDVLEAMAEMNPEELFKTCTQLAILQNNVPSEKNILTLEENEIMSLAENYAKAVMARIREV